MVKNLELIATKLGQENFWHEDKKLNLTQFIALVEESITLAKAGDRALLDSLVEQFPKLVEKIEGQGKNTSMSLISADLLLRQKNQARQTELSQLAVNAQPSQPEETPKEKITVSDEGHVSLNEAGDIDRVDEPNQVQTVDATGPKILSLSALQKMVKIFPNLNTITALEKIHQEFNTNYKKRSYLEIYRINFFPRKPRPKKPSEKTLANDIFK